MESAWTTREGACNDAGRHLVNSALLILPSHSMQEAARRIARVSVEAKLPVTEKDYVNVRINTYSATTVDRIVSYMLI